MNKTLFLCAAVLFASVAIGDKIDVKNMTDEQRAARREQIREMRRRSTGGYLIRPNSQQGRIVFFNCQKSVDSAAVKKAATELMATYGFNFAVTTLDVAPDANGYLGKLKADHADFGVFVIADAASPYSVGIYPEQRFATINVNVIGSEPERVRKELIRTIPLLCGGLSTTELGALMQPISVPLDIDTIIDTTIPYDAVNKMMPYLRSFGVTPQIRRSYKTACIEGWAPAPTNDVQKAIWNKIHAMPSSPIKINPEVKKVKE